MLVKLESNIVEKEVFVVFPTPFVLGKQMNSDLLYCACRAGTAPPSRFSSLGTLLQLLVLRTLGLIELRLISPLLTALLQAQPYLLLVGQ